LAWAALAMIMALAVAHSPTVRTVTHNYRNASHQWFQGQDIYCEGAHGFLYFPHAAILFAPFAYLPAPAGDVLWRVVGIGGLAFAIWRTAKLGAIGGGDVWFSCMTCLAMGPALASARNGQMNLATASLMTLAAITLACRRWRAAALWLCLGIALKPLMAIPAAIAIVVYRPVARPMAVGLLLVVLTPLATQDPAYVWRQYQGCFEKLLVAGNPGAANRHADLFGLLTSLGLTVDVGLQTAARVAAGGLALALCLAARRRWCASRASVLILTVTACYLTLFNPRAENNSYVLLAPSLGALAGYAFLVDRRPGVGWTMIFLASGITAGYELTRGPNFWLNPLLALLLLTHAVAQIVGPRGHGARAREPRRVPRTRPSGALRALPRRLAGGAACDHDLTVVVPAFNERERLPRTLEALCGWLDAWGVDYRVLVVDDGSDDGTSEIAGRFGTRCGLLRLGRRGGKGAAVRHGVLAATGRVVAFTDADLPYALGSLRTAFDWIDAGRCAVVFGARDLPGSTSCVPRRPARVAASFAFRWLTKRLVSRRVTDTQCGLKAFRADAAREIFSRTRIHGFAFDAEVVWLAHRLKMPFCRVPVSLVNEYGSSLSVARHGWRMLFDVVRLRLVRRCDDPLGRGTKRLAGADHRRYAIDTSVPTDVDRQRFPELSGST